MRTYLGRVVEPARPEPDVSEDLLLETADPIYRRRQAIERSAQFGETFVDQATGEIRSLASLIPRTFAAERQLGVELPQYAKRAWIRAALAERIASDVLPLTSTRWIHEIPHKLRTARQSGAFGIEISSGKPVMFWDLKAGLAKLCPDDAREEAQRLRRRVQKPLEDLQASGAKLDFTVFTTPNVARGELAGEMRAIYKRFRELLPKMPEITGAVAVLEAPLGAAGDWNVHVNAILVTRARAFPNWAKLRKLWGFNVHVERIEAEQGAVGSSIAELIKYALQTCAEKSHWKAGREEQRAQEAAPGDRALRADVARFERSAVAALSDVADHSGAARAQLGAESVDGGASNRTRSRVRAADPERPNRRAAPSFLEWPPRACLEWLEAMHGFRRTRTYGELYGLKDPEKAELGPIAWIGAVSLQGGRYALRMRLLDSIPEDKSAPSDRRIAWERFLKRIKPPDPDALRLLEQLPRLG